METSKIGFNLKRKVEPSEAEINNFVRAVAGEFFRRKKDSADGLLSKQERAKNGYLAKLFISKILDGRIDEEFDSSMSKDEIEKHKRIMRDTRLWIKIINFLFDNTVKSGFGYYVQTVNGAFKFYLSGKYQAIGSSNGQLLAQDYLLLKEIRSWKEYEIMCCFNLFLCKIYEYLNPNNKW